MKIIKRIIKQKLTTGVTENCNIENNCFVIIPDNNVTYHIQILLVNNNLDFGFFDSIFPEYNLGLHDPQTISGTSKSRLSELKKYNNDSSNFFDNYYHYPENNNGIVISESNLNSNPIKITYIIDNIKYVDKTYDGEFKETTFIFNYNGLNDENFVKMKTIKNPHLSNVVNKPKILNDVFIIRQEIPVFQDNFILKDIKTLYDLETYTGGNYFNIKK